MTEYVPVRGYQELQNFLKAYENKQGPIYLYFYGEKDSKGKSWCPDCVDAEETIMTAFRNHARQAIVLVIDVGNRDAWMDSSDKNGFRKPPLSLSSIPSLLHWKGVERLEGDQLLKSSLLELFFEETSLKSGPPSSARNINK
ncbi:thioredoxin domain-containing protein 17 [Drosophila pseudoobscura]|uniref:Thioredoxin domain-containing protein 17 n=1 Tax=Drosophila pseudoobscura pseudoobscura TaxID=46245 RepID=Q29HN9_DROPS|nr:thioredoxin domain-containing protein 17 [Drosophila pseudoobscura]